MIVDDTKANLVALSFLFTKLEDQYQVNLMECTSGLKAIEDFKNHYE